MAVLVSPAEPEVEKIRKSPETQASLVLRASARTIPKLEDIARTVDDELPRLRRTLMAMSAHMLDLKQTEIARLLMEILSD